MRAEQFARALERHISRVGVQGSINLLAPDRSVFRFDCDALDRFAPRLNIMRISSRRQLPSMRLGEHEGLQQREIGAPRDSEADPFRESQPALERALQRSVSRGLLQGVLTANVDYHQDEPLRRAAAQLGLPVFVLLKETPISHAHAVWQAEAIGDTPIEDRGDHVFVGGRLGKLYVENGSVAPERLYVTGFPRFDHYRDDRALLADRVVLFPPNRLHQHDDETFGRLLDATLDLRRRTASRLILKCKDNRAARDAESALERRVHDTESVLVTTENPAKHLVRSALVIGASTTALVEALLTSAQVWNLVSRGDLLGIEDRSDLGYRTFASIDALLTALRSLSSLDGLPVPADLSSSRRGLVAETLAIPETRTASSLIEEQILRIVEENALVR